MLTLGKRCMNASLMAMKPGSCPLPAHQVSVIGSLLLSAPPTARESAEPPDWPHAAAKTPPVTESPYRMTRRRDAVRPIERAIHPSLTPGLCEPHLACLAKSRQQTPAARCRTTCCTLPRKPLSG